MGRSHSTSGQLRWSPACHPTSSCTCLLQLTCESSRRVLLAFHLGAVAAKCGCRDPNMTSTKARPGSCSLPPGLDRTDSVSCSRSYVTCNGKASKRQSGFVCHARHASSPQQGKWPGRQMQPQHLQLVHSGCRHMSFLILLLLLPLLTSFASFSRRSGCSSPSSGGSSTATTMQVSRTLGSTGERHTHTRRCLSNSILLCCLHTALLAALYCSV